ncbi:hypothetical protein [Bradyrhizobium uaiense]|uniref:EAL domain-containing protein n=1 Tax=Bradyrhizobium uaiense TaxID=2594946 RepID=A0A6P1BPD7_9BRAD|nr:hypothetical protein [Bradyrhizobium uaiense]NEV00236.1 hypothetical protein [Bradyrhizobium uaiense]
MSLTAEPWFQRLTEGAELPADVDVLGTLDCDLVQGFAFSTPIVADQAPLVAASIEREACGMQPKRNRLQSMIRKSAKRFSLATNAERVCAEIMLKQRAKAR